MTASIRRIPTYRPILTAPERKERNPIFWQEITHQTRAAPRRTRIGQLAAYLALIAIIFGIPLLLLDPILAARSAREFAMVSVWVIHAIVAARCIIAGSNTLSREHVNQSWDSLVLTGISARSILLGKFFAGLRRAAPWVVAFGTVRLAMLPVMMMGFAHRYAQWASRRGYYNYYDDGTPFNIEFLFWAALAAVVGTIILTMIEAACCVALGMLGSALTKRGATAAAFAMTIRFVPVALFWGMTRYELGTTRTWRYFRHTPFAIADGGTAPLMTLVSPLTSWTSGRHEAALGPYFLVFALLVGITVVSLMTTLWLLRQSGALPVKTA